MTPRDIPHVLLYVLSSFPLSAVEMSTMQLWWPHAEDGRSSVRMSPRMTVEKSHLIFLSSAQYRYLSKTYIFIVLKPLIYLGVYYYNS